MNRLRASSPALVLFLAGLLAGTGHLALAIGIIAAELTVVTAAVLRLRPMRNPSWTISPA